MSKINPDRILYEDEHLLIVNKLAGELVVAADGGGKLPLYDFLHKNYPGLRVMHRLDFGTSGVLVFAKDAESLKRVRESKFEGWIKRYRMIASGHMEQKVGSIRKPLPARTHKDLVDAVTHYTVLKTFRDASYVETQIETGRKHQIRQHMKSIGHPLVLDPLYGDPRRDRSFKKHFKYRRFFLHAFALEFPHPMTGKKLSVIAPLPKSFQEALDALSAKHT